MWAIDQAMEFHSRPAEVREEVVARVMREAKRRFNHDVTAKHYIEIYEKMLDRPLLRHFAGNNA